MFTALNPGISRRRTTLLSVSIAFHGLLLVWLLSPPSPKFLAPSSVAVGVPGGSVTALYWPTHQAARNDSPSAALGPERQEARKRLTWNRPPKARKAELPEPSHARIEAEAQAPDSGSGNPTPPAGVPYGSQGSPFGDEVRPALPVAAYDPVVDPNELPGHIEGSIVVEITIDDKGNIVQKTVLQSLGPAIDNKVLAALENWHFRPATRNGVAIPSKQDVYYHFKPQA